MPQKRFYLRRCSRNERSSASLLNFRRNSRSRSKTFHNRSSLSYCYLTFFIRVWHYFHSFTALQRFSAMLNLCPCLGSQCMRVELTFGLAIFICIILSSRFILFLDLFSLSSRLPQELTLLLRTDRLFRSSLRVLLRVGLTLSFMILSYRDSLLQAEMKLELLCFFYLRQDLLAFMEFYSLLLLLQKEKSRFMLDMLLEADEKDVSRRLFSFDFMQGCILSLRGQSYSGQPISFLAFCRVVNRDIIAITDKLQSNRIISHFHNCAHFHSQSNFPYFSAVSRPQGLQPYHLAMFLANSKTATERTQPQSTLESTESTV